MFQKDRWNENVQYPWEEVRKIWLKYWDYSNPIFLDKSIPIEHYAEVCNKAIDRGIFIKGGDKPNPKDFLQMAVQLATDYGIK